MPAKQYAITWGDDSATYTAADKTEAWAMFCEKNDKAQRFPNLYERKIEEVAPPEVKPEKKGK